MSTAETMPETPVEEEEVKPINLAEIRNSTDLSEIERRLREHPESAVVIAKIEKQAAKILGKSIVDIKSMTISDIREDLDKTSSKTVGIHKSQEEKLSAVIDALLHKAESLSYVEDLLGEI